MDLTSKNRKELTNLQDPIQLSELNKQLRWLFTQVMGGLPLKGLNKEAQEFLESRVGSEELDKYSLITQTEDAITAAVADLNMGQYSTTQQTADAIHTAVVELNLGQYATQEDAEAAAQAAIAALNLGQYTTPEEAIAAVRASIAQSGIDGYSTTAQTASSISSAVADKASVSYVNQTASSLSSTISGVSSTANAASSTASQALQTANNFSWRLASGAFETRIANAESNPNGGGNEYGLYLYYNSTYYGGVWMDSVFSGLGVGSGSRRTVVIGSELWLMGPYGNKIIIGQHAISGDYGIVCVGNVLPSDGNTYNLGGDGNNRRWKRLYTNNSVNVSSDARLKRDIADLDVDGLIDLLRPRKFRMVSEGDTGKWRWGFVAQEVKEALEALGIAGVEFLDDDNPDHLALCYTELVAVLVKGWQEQQRKIDAMEGQIYALEKRLAALEVTRDDRR